MEHVYVCMHGVRAVGTWELPGRHTLEMLVRRERREGETEWGKAMGWEDCRMRSGFTCQDGPF